MVSQLLNAVLQVLFGQMQQFVQDFEITSNTRKFIVFGVINPPQTAVLRPKKANFVTLATPTGVLHVSVAYEILYASPTRLNV